MLITRDFWLTEVRLRLAVDKRRTGNLLAVTQNLCITLCRQVWRYARREPVKHDENSHRG